MTFKQKLQSAGFTAGHAQLLVVAFVILGGLTISQTNIHITSLFAHADDSAQPMLTYEEVKKQVELSSPVTTADTAASDKQVEDQIALIDRSIDSGSVLGDVTGVGDIPNADSIFSESALDQIPVNVFYNATSVDYKTYVDNIDRIELSYDTISLLGDINGSDQAAMKNAQSKLIELTTAYKAMPVPDDLVTYHKYRMMYFTALSNMADIWLGNRPQTDLKAQSSLLFSVMNKIQTLSSENRTKYNITLP